MQKNGKSKCVRAGQLLCAALCMGILFGGMLAHILMPDAAGSRQERRRLASLPSWDAAAWRQGTLADRFERYAQEQFPLRSALRTGKACVQMGLLARKENHGVYLSAGQLYKPEARMNAAEIQKAADKFREVAGKYLAGRRLYTCVVPDKSEFLAPAGQAADSRAVEGILREALGADFAHIEVRDLLGAEAYYRTDIHWAQERILPVAQRVARAMGREVRAADFAAVRAGELYGSYYGQAALPLAPDELWYLDSEAIRQMQVYHLEGDRVSGVYDPEKALGEGSMDGYDLFLSGAEAFLRIDNPAGEGELVLFRDSFGSSLAPLLAGSYARVSIVDLRYISTEALGQFLEVSPEADVLFLYSTVTLNHASMLK